MNDNRIIVLLTRKMAGEINELEQEELTKLLSESPEAIYYDEFVKELWSQDTVQNSDPQAFYQRHKAKHQHKFDFVAEKDDENSFNTKLEKRWSLRRKWFFYSAAASVISVLLIGFFWRRYSDQDALGNRIEIVAEKGVRKQWILPDGTKVWLNADSRLSYNDFKDARRRLVSLEGEAYFDVAKDRNKPFIIRTEEISIRVLGTAFNVKAYPNEQKTEATLIKGAIELSVNKRPKERIVLKPSEKIAVINSKQAMGARDKQPNSVIVTIGNLSKVHVEDKEYIQETSWIDNKLIFKNETMEELIPKLERWYNVNIQVSAQKVKSYRYTANIAGENITQLLNAMQLIKPFQYKIEDDEIIIY
ncbi:MULTISPECIES: FecR family protein [Olivibacter]|uniref:FecR family protein n=1 Tax=Olivibacter jilunii TaxID=985016 RepID=A0ABW6AWD8_9SPHI|nr:FecR family protein [Olivibacter sp. UJ_SKK_5.1]MDX3913684.1 FecR family protein [Pseudosphingobacterium sp.]